MSEKRDVTALPLATKVDEQTERLSTVRDWIASWEAGLITPTQALVKIREAVT